MSSTESLSEEESLPSCNGTDDKYAYLVVDDEWHEVAVGETKIGRDASKCSIVLGDGTLSMLHAVIESEGPEDSFIHDANSSNKTRIGKMRLKPYCRYKINDNDTIIMGNKVIHYKVVNHRIENCKTESSSNVFKLGTSGEKGNETINDKTKLDPLDGDENLVLNTEEHKKNLHVPLKSLTAPENISNTPIKSYYILASELFNTDIFSQATQCEIKNESLKARNTELVDSDDDIHNMETQCHHSAGTDKGEPELKCYKGSSEKDNKITESCFDDSATFDFVRRNESKYILSSSFCKSIGDDIFELPTQLQSTINDSQKVLIDKDHNFRSCFPSKLFNADKPQGELESASKRELESNSCKTKTKNLNSGDVDSEFFDDDKDQELYELMRAISPRINESDDWILNHRKRLTENKALEESNVTSEIFEFKNPFDLDVSSNKHFEQSKSKALDLEYNENEKSKLDQTNERGKELKRLNNSAEICNMMTEKGKICSAKYISKRELQKGEGDIVNTNGTDIDGVISKFDHDAGKISNHERTKNSGGNNPSSRTYSLNSDNECDDSRSAVEKNQGMRRGSLSPNDVASELLNDEFEAGSEGRARGEDPHRKGVIIKSPLNETVSDTLNEVWEKQSKCSPASSNKTLSDLDVSEFQGNFVAAFESDSEEDFISTQGLCSLSKSSCQKVNNKIEPAVWKTRRKLDIWKENWQDFIFTQHVSDENSKKSESESTDKTESDIVVSTKPIPNMEHYELNEKPSEEGLFSIGDDSNESECLLKKKIEDESSSSRDVGFVEEDCDEFICESPILLQSNVQTENIQDGEEGNPIKSERSHEYVPNKNGVVSDPDESDCKDTLTTRKLSFSHKFPDFDNNQRREEVFPSTSNLKGKNFRESKQIPVDDITTEKREDSPLKRTMRNDKDVILPEKRSKNVRKRKESDGVGGRQLRSRSVKACKERYQSGDGEAKNEVKGSCGKRVVNASTKKLGFVLEKSLNDCDRLENSCSESRWQPPSVKIVFTGFESESHNRIISRLGGLRVNDFNEGNVLVTDKVRRTVKFLSAVALGLPIVSPKWLLSSNKELQFLNPWNFILEDNASEELWGFSLKASLENWKTDKLLDGFNVFATKNTKPPVPEILSIVECCGGMTFTSYPEVWPENSIVLTCMEDKKSWPHYKFRSIKILHYEFLLSGVLKHAMDFKKYKLR